MMEFLQIQWWRLSISPANRNELFSVDCHGLENPCIEDKLVEMIRAKDPSVMLLAETWVDEAWLKHVLWKIQFENIFIAPRLNKGGGLVLFWRSSIDVSVVGLSKNYIDVIINKNKEDECRFTGFYGEPKTQRRFEPWDQLRNLDRKFQIPWLCRSF